MSVKNFKFVSPGVFIKEIDLSGIEPLPAGIGPVVIGRSTRGLALQPIRVESYSKYVENFGDTVPGGVGGDVYRNGNLQSPMYGTYASKAFLVSNVAPLTYIRLLGAQHPNATNAGRAGWQTTLTSYAKAGDHGADVGGAYGLFLFPSSSGGTDPVPGTVGRAGPADEGHLAAIIYAESGSYPQLSGTLWGTGSKVAEGIGALITSETSGRFLHTVHLSGSNYSKKIKFNFDDNSDSYIRDQFNTNPQLTTEAGTFFSADSRERYWLGETFDQEIRDASLVGAATLGYIIPLSVTGSSQDDGPSSRRVASQEARAGWFIGQHLGTAGTYVAEDAQKLFRLIGRGHGEWLHKNCKVSIQDIRQSRSTSTDYGTFAVVIRALHDSDNAPIVLERFDNCTLDPASPNYIGRVIGNQYVEWDDTERRLRTYGEYENNSKYVYVDVSSAVDEGAADPQLLPFGYYGPPRYDQVTANGGGGKHFKGFNSGAMCDWGSDFAGALKYPISAEGGATNPRSITSSFTLNFPSARLRSSSLDGGVADSRNAYFGFQSTRTATSTRADVSVADTHNMLDARLVASVDPTTASLTGVEGFSYIFSLLDVVKSGTTYNYESGSYKGGTSVSSASYKELLNQGYSRFTAPFYGGYDGLDVHLPDPFYNAGMEGASEKTNSAYYTIKRAMDTVADAEAADMNMLTMPGLTVDGLNQHMINICEERGDAMSIIDLDNVYTPPHEAYKTSKKARLGPGPTFVARSLKDKRIDSSYAAAFYPWVSTRDENTGRVLWVPPSVAMMGVLASSQRKSHVWFAPAGFNRGGLTDGAAGIPIVSVSEKLTSKDRDTLYEAKINPIASFPSTGLVVFGQKTLQERASALDRINVRRLVIYLKKQISLLSTQVLFEQNIPTTWNRFKSLVEPFLANVKVQFGISDYRLILDETTTTPDLVDQNILYAKIMVKPARAIEYIAIDFVVASTGASFDD